MRFGISKEINNYYNNNQSIIDNHSNNGNHSYNENQSNNDKNNNYTYKYKLLNKNKLIKLLLFRLVLYDFISTMLSLEKYIIYISCIFTN